jgi:hypothetical protein
VALAETAVTGGRARRFVLLAACVLGGLAVGIAGRAVSGDDAWFLALPAAVALGWLFVGDPTRCGGPGCPPRD